MNYCFGDFEFTCGRKREHGHRELLSAGLLFFDTNFNEIGRYYQTAKPSVANKLTPFCIDLTGLTQKEIDRSHDSEYIFTDVLKLLAEYHADTIFVMGANDELNLREDAKVHNKHHYKQKHNGNELAEHIFDIQPVLKTFSKIETSESLGIQKYLDFYHLEPEGELHNALVDAAALAEIYKKVIYLRDVAKTPEILEYEETIRIREEELQKQRLEKLKEAAAKEEQ